MLKQVGIVAGRTEDGEFLPAHPIYRDVADDGAENKALDEFAKIAAEMMGRYIRESQRIEREHRKGKK